MSIGDLRKDGSLFFGVDTPLGPVYLAAGFDEGGDKAFYLFLGGHSNPRRRVMTVLGTGRALCAFGNAGV